MFNVHFQSEVMNLQSKQKVKLNHLRLQVISSGFFLSSFLSKEKIFPSRGSLHVSRVSSLRPVSLSFWPN